MALIQVNFVSNALKRTVPLQVILPVDKGDGSGFVNGPEQRYPTLYLLHGLFGNYTDWVSNTRVQMWAEEKNLAVVMPSGDNSFYVDQLGPNNDYGAFIGEELVELTRRMFPLSRRREQTFIGGLSMGGFGALRNGLKYAETFGGIAALSSALHLFEFAPGDPRREMLMREDACLGDWQQAAASDKNPAVALEELTLRVKAKKAEFPRIYMACGTEDGLLQANRSFRDKLLAAGAPLTSREAPGIHDWNFWDAQLPQVLSWLPLETSAAGLNSGNVHVEKK